jgi:putative ABC transport system ATP-binding protein
VAGWRPEPNLGNFGKADNSSPAIHEDHNMAEDSGAGPGVPDQSRLDGSAEAATGREGAAGGRTDREGRSLTSTVGEAARARDVWKVYGSGEAQVVALRGISADFARARFTAIMGPSGSGKSTLMHCLAGLDTVDRGAVWIGDQQVTGLSDAGLTRLRRERVGFVFQQFNLLPTLTAQENILLPLTIAGRRPEPEWYSTVIDTIGLRDRLTHRPAQLSGGQQQRVACARALISRPDVVFADEPTGNLDSRSGAEVLGFLRESVRAFEQTIVMVTHDPNAASYADRVVFLADGQLVDELSEPTPERVLDRMRHLDTEPEDGGV